VKGRREDTLVLQNCLQFFGQLADLIGAFEAYLLLLGLGANAESATLATWLETALPVQTGLGDR